MRKVIMVLTVIGLICVSGCDPSSPEYEFPNINDYVSVDLPDTANQTMIPEKYSYYKNVKNQIQSDYNEQYNVLYDQWNRNRITTEEFKRQLEILNADKKAKDDAIDYRRLTEPWWQPLEMEITIDNSDDYSYKYVTLFFTVTYHDGSSEEIEVDCPNIYPLSRADEDIVIETNYLIKTYACSRADYLLGE